MSFPRAKRFDYKYPDFSASPADYYITCNFGNGLTIPKGSRLRKGTEKVSLTSTRCENCTCSRCPRNSSTRYVDITSFSSRNSMQGNPKASSTPQKSMMDNRVTGIFNRNDIKNCSFREKTQKQLVTNSRNQNKEMQYQRDRSLSTMPFWQTDECIDDDYHSYTSSEELDSLKRFQAENNNDMDKKDFETTVLKQMEQINLNIQKFQIDLKELKSNMKKSKKVDEPKDGNIQISDGIKSIIQNSIEKLRNNFESTQNIILSQTLNRINVIAREIRKASKLSKNKLDNLCKQVALDLVERVYEIAEKDDTLEFETSNGCEEQLQEIDNIVSPDLDSYEDVCQVLSDNLQISQRELEDLIEDKSYIKRKFGYAKQSIDAQSKIIKNLHKNLAELKNSYKK